MIAPVRHSVAHCLDRASFDDRELRERILRGLWETGHLDLRRLEVEAHGEWVRLSGTVRSFFAKQKAQIVVGSVVEVRQLDNEVCVI
jgi:osmotically-inducible protein OsmY